MKMTEDKIDIKMFAPCGMNCKVCYKHCYSKKSCGGCFLSDEEKPEHCRKCKIKDCVIERLILLLSMSEISLYAHNTS